MAHYIGLLCIALTVLIPMPIAGGIPLLLGTMTLLLVLSARPHFTNRLEAQPQLVCVFTCALMILGWETFTALFHYTLRDLELIAARGVWVLLGFAYLTILAGQGEARTARNLTLVLLLGCSAMLLAMALESAFYPTYEVGRQLGTLNIPWPRATGVPQSDGKIGVYMCLASVFFVVAFANTRRWYMLLGLFLSIAPIVFTQSRSTLVGLLLTLGFLFLFYVRTTRNVYLKTLALVGGGLFLWQFALNFDEIYQTLRGEGVFARNVDARSDGTEHAVNVLADNAIIGPGAEYLLLEGMHKLEVHSTFLGLAVKNGLPGPLLFIGFMFISALPACDRSARLPDNLLMVCALVAGPISEHNLYPGYFNEHLWLTAPIAVAVHYFQYSDEQDVSSSANEASRRRLRPGRQVAGPANAVHRCRPSRR